MTTALKLADKRNFEDRSKLLGNFEINQILNQGDIETINYLIDNNISLGSILEELVGRKAFVEQESTENTYVIYDLFDKLITKDLPARAVDQALSTALMHAKWVLVNLLIKDLPKVIKEIPKEKQKIINTVKYLAHQQYTKNDNFKRALNTESQDLVKLFLEAGTKPTEKDLASVRNNSQLLELLKKAAN